MGWKRTAAFLLLFSLASSTLLYADGTSQKIKVLFNSRELSDGAYIIDGKTYVPIRELGGMVNYNDDSKTVKFNKPNVHIFLFKGDTPFGNVNVGKLKFNVFCQIDSLTADISSVKVAITAPDGSVKSIQSQEIGKDQKDNFWFRTADFTYEFNSAGKYSVGFYMKGTGDDDYTLISQKVITAIGS
ncbi:copper amine oxidase [Paenibacillus yonginensis]|uniref:Copper amine oxidase n=1 Tax=Paenibacillus yonginensis TaxID=1462996 RepID=A0A1B1N0S6_9BACL|nr:copper amine oxidase [Paenibacillus yonginensis]ANS75040.1 copper amine oxidase [Paenibacillus yonginensis]